MQPLKSRTKAASPIEAAAIALLRSVERYQPPSGQKQRVRLRLFEAQPVPRHGFHISRSAFVLAAILIAAGASAAIGGNWVSSKVIGASANLKPASVAPAAKPLSRLEPVRITGPSSPLAVASADEPAKAAIPVPSLESTSRVEPRLAASSEQSLVFDAMRALRREGQPERAARLLDDYLRRYPKGSLSEEALALAIEAKSALGDPRARVFAERYLSNYPDGRFRSAALRARARFSP